MPISGKGRPGVTPSRPGNQRRQPSDFVHAVVAAICLQAGYSAHGNQAQPSFAPDRVSLCVRRPRSGKPQRSLSSAGEGGHFAGKPDFRPLYIRRQLGLRATLQRSLPSVSCTKRPNGHKARVSGWSPISDSSAIPSKLAPHRKVRVRKADYAWSLGG